MQNAMSIEAHHSRSRFDVSFDMARIQWPIVTALCHPAAQRPHASSQ